MTEQRARRMFHDCAAHKPVCPVHDHPELPTSCTCPAYSHPLCIFNYCPDPEFCKVPGVGCVNHSKDAAQKRLAEQGGTECVKPPAVPCDTPDACRYDPVLNICDACGSEVVILYAKKPR